MKLEIYAVHDAAVGAYNRPLFFRSRGEAIRSFEQAVRDEQNGFGAHPEHFTFVHIGFFDDTTGFIEVCEPDRVCSALDFKPASPAGL